jgi:hypothetical protein
MVKHGSIVSSDSVRDPNALMVKYGGPNALMVKYGGPNALMVKMR